jgi:hypothetical protein
MPSHGLSPAQQVVLAAAVVVEVAAAVAAVGVHLPPQLVELLLLLAAALAVVELAVVERQLPIWLLSAITSRTLPQIYPQQTPRPRARRPRVASAVPAAAVRCPAPMWCPI